MDKKAKKKCKKCGKEYGGYSTGPAKGHLDTQLFPGTEGTKFDRNIVKKTVERRKKNISPYAFNLKEYKLAQFKPFPPQTYYYYINLDERGSFYADVRSESGKTLFEIKDGNELGPDEISIFDDGFMKNKNDLVGLKEYLVSLGIMKPNQVLMKGN